MGVGYSVIINWFSTFLSFYLPCVYIFTPKSGSRIVNWIRMSVLYGLWVMLSRFVLTFHSVLWVFAGNFILIWSLFRLLYRESWKRRLAALCFCVGTAAISEIVSIQYMRVFIPTIVNRYLRAERGELTNLMQLIGNLCFEMVYTVMTAAYLCLWQRKAKNLFLAFLLLPLYQLVLVTGFSVLCNDFTEQVAWTGLVIGIFCFVVDGTMLLLLHSILQKQDLEARMKALEETRRREYAYFETVSSGLEEMRMIRHDFSNQLQTVYRMAEGSGNRDTVRRMLEEIEKRIGKQGGIG